MKNEEGMPNLIINPDFETGNTSPRGWRSVGSPKDMYRFLWDDSVCKSGRRSVCIEGRGKVSDFGMWQQIVPVKSGKVHTYTAHVAFRDIPENKGRCFLQVAFLDSEKRKITVIDLPGHWGSRGFSFDYPPRLKVRAPEGSVEAEVNLVLRGSGKAWFDDVFFGMTPCGRITGKVSSEGKSLEDAHVFVWGDPWGKKHEAFTDANGDYAIEDVPKAFPRYIVMAEKPGYKAKPRGDIDADPGSSVCIAFDLDKGENPDDLKIKWCEMECWKVLPNATMPEGAVIPSNIEDYPEDVRPFLEPGRFITSDHPDVVELARRIKESLPERQRHITERVLFAAHEWLSKHIEHEGLFMETLDHFETPFNDVTGGGWQTIGKNGWCWGRNVHDWCYKPHESLETETTICLEGGWIETALLRALSIPAQALPATCLFWAQTADGRGSWTTFAYDGGRGSYRESGRLGDNLVGGIIPLTTSPFPDPLLYERWNMRNKGLWHETHPLHEEYRCSKEGYEQAVADIEKFRETGIAFSKRDREFIRHYRPEDLEQGRLYPAPNEDHYVIHYFNKTINLYTAGDQRILDVSFILIRESDMHKPTGQRGYWTNHPECVKRTWIEEVKNPPVKDILHLYHIEFDLSFLLD